MRALFLVTAVFGSAFAWSADPMQMDVRPAFDGPLAGTNSVVVELSNDGPDARGAVVVSDDGGDTTYPVELPRGARKRLLTLPRTRWGDIVFTLETNQGAITRKLGAVGYDDSSSAVAAIGDDSGGFAFLRQDSAAAPEKARPGYPPQNVRVRDAYSLPEVAPDRPAAYRPFSAVFLGPGAERMADGTVAALRDYVLGGGTVVFVGGASAPTLEDRRWADVLPGSGWKPRTLAGSALLGSLGGEPLTAAFTVLSPSKIAPGATVKNEGGTTILSERPLGLGRVVVLGFTPLDAPLSAWPGRTHAVSAYVRGGTTLRGKALLSSYLQENNPYGTTVYMAGSMGMPGRRTYYSPSTPSLENDPFGTKLPPSGTVFGILSLYFVLVVPVSFLLLRKLKRGEWAWFTAPILSLGFAALLFRSAQGLYAASLSTSTNGIVVLQQGVPDAMFYGTSQMFFPRGGVYDLKLHGVDSLAPVGGEDYYRYGRNGSSLAGFHPVDVGEVVAPQLEANNLSFRQVGLSQRLDDVDWVRISRKDADHAIVLNRSPYAMSGSLVHEKTLGKPFDLAPGASKVVELGGGDKVDDTSNLPPDDARNFTRGNGRLAFSGTLTGFRPGPQLGNEVAGRGRIAVLAFGGEGSR